MHFGTPRPWQLRSAVVALLVTLMAAASIDAQGRRSLADKHAPAFLMSDHLHGQGEFMVEYKLMHMAMDGNRVGTRSVSDQEALTVGQSLGTNFGATPTNMTMDMHMIHIMYGVTDDVTAYIMPQFSVLDMDHIRGPVNPAPAGPGSSFNTRNTGIDDTVVGMLYNLYDNGRTQLIFNSSYSLPTGELDRKSSNPTGGLVEQELPYPMRRGSGTVNARPALTMKTYYDWFSTGLQAAANIPIGENNEDYSVGNEFRANGWVSGLVTDNFALSYRVEGLFRGNYDGADPQLNGMVISTARPDMRASESVNFGYGAMYLFGKGNLLNVELVHPVYQHFDGIQLENDWSLAVSISRAFGGHKKDCHCAGF